MFKKKFFNTIITDKSLILILFFLSFFVNQYYGNIGVFPIDTFLHFDTGYRILIGEHPIKDYWVVSGIFLDYLQAFFFRLFGVSWKSYLLHASLINGLLAIATYFILRSFKLEKKYSFFYSISFSLLAYPPSGTPFVDHHAAFLSLLGLYFLILAIKENKNFYWFLTPVFLGLAFISKQVPSTYVIIFFSFIIISYFIAKRNFNSIKYLFFGSLFFLIIIFLAGNFIGISLGSFLEQYIIYPRSIGSDRFANLNITINNIFGHYKFIYISFLPLLLINLQKIYKNKYYVKDDNFYFFLILFLFTVSLIFHQLLTKNQVFIYFLIPILSGFSQIYLKKNNIKNKKFIFILIFLFCLFATIKYHQRFNENRKFHDLQDVNFDLSINAEKLNKNLLGLKWITPEKFINDPNAEILFLSKVQKILMEDKRNKMILTNYLFFSANLKESLNAPSRTFTLDGASFPIKGNKHYASYKNLIINIIKKNKISVIYLLDTGKIDDTYVYDYIDKNCFNEVHILEQFKSYELKECSEIKG
tara:strand:- start:793 stop:2382 length:1590 start_codon:yes stop_codon:yes gene_type:complete